MGTEVVQTNFRVLPQMEHPTSTHAQFLLHVLLLTYVHPVEFTVLFESFDPLPLKLKNIFYIIKLTRFFLIPSSDLSETFVLIRFKWTI